MEDKTGLRKIYRKSWPYDNLFGTLRFDLDSAQRGIWNDLLDMAKLGRVMQGLVAPGQGCKYSHEWLAAFLNVPLELLNETIELLIKTERICENGSGIGIINWKKYQTEYDRQKPYRTKSKKEREEEKVERRRLGLCENCGEEGHNKFNCPYSKYQDLVQR